MNLIKTYLRGAEGINFYFTYIQLPLSLIFVVFVRLATHPPRGRYFYALLVESKVLINKVSYQCGRGHL